MSGEPTSVPKSVIDSSQLNDRLRQELRAAATTPQAGPVPARPAPESATEPPPPARLVARLVARVAAHMGRRLAHHSGVEAEIARLEGRLRDQQAAHEEAM